MLYFRRIAENLEENLPNLESLILTNNSVQELGDLDSLSSVSTLTTLRSVKLSFSQLLINWAISS